MRGSDANIPLVVQLGPDSHVIRSSGSGERNSATDRVAEAVAAGLLMFRAARRQWRCFMHTAGAHEIDIHSGVCRYCGARTAERL